MTCHAFDEDLSAHLDGELSAVEERRLLDHLAVCAECRASRDEFVRLSSVLKRADELPAFSAPEEFEERVVRRAGRVRRCRVVLRLPQLPVGRVAAAALLLVAAVLSIGVLLDATVPTGDAVVFVADRPDYSDALAGCRERLDEQRAFAGPERREVARFDNRGEMGPALPLLPQPRRPVPAEPPAARSVYELLGLSRVGDVRLTGEAYQRVREHREQERLLARANDLRDRVHGEETPTRADENAVVAWFGGLAVGTSASHGDFKVVPILDGDGDAGVLVLEARDALRRRILSIREDRSTARLTAVNSDPDRYVFLPAGAVLVGGQQDRMVTRATLIPPNSRASLPVLCCEKDRYVGPRDTFMRLVGIAPPEIRGLLLGAVNQEEVWARIDEVLERLGVRSKTRALREIFEDGRGPEAVRKYTAGLTGVFRDERSVGFLVYEDGRFIGGEVFASHSVLEAEGSKFVASYILGRVGRRGGVAAPATVADPAGILAIVGRASFFPTPGAVSGQESEFVSVADAVSGTSLIPVAGARPLHVFLRQGVAELAGTGKETGEDGRVDRPPVDRDGGDSGDGQTHPRVRRRIEERRQDGPGSLELDPPNRDTPRLPDLPETE